MMVAGAVAVEPPGPAGRPRPGAREWSLPLVLFVALAAGVCGPAVVGRAGLGPERVLDADPLYGALPEEAVPALNDPTPIVLDLPRDLAFAHGLRAGRLDAWNPHVGCGAPLWAEQGGPFFPLKLPFYLWPSRATHALFLLLRLVAAGLGAYLLGRRRGLSLEAATVGGAMFELSGALFAHLAFAAASAVYLLPWALLGAEAIARARDARASLRCAVATGAAIGLVGHAGHPTLITMVLAGFAAAVAGHAIAAGGWRAAGRVAAFSLLAGVIGLALAAPALLPLAELASVGRSYKDTDSGQRIWLQDLGRFRRSLPIALFAPHLLEGMRRSLETLFPYVFAPALGVLGLTLGVAGVLGGGIGPSLALPLVLGVALATAPPGLAWVHRLPALRLIMPQYPWALVALPLSLSAGHALDSLGQRRGRYALALAALLLLVAASSLRTVRDDPSHMLRFRRALLLAVSSRKGRLLYYLPLSLAPTLAVAVAVADWRRVPVRAVRAVLGLLAVLELGAVTMPPSRTPRSLALRRPPSGAVRFLAQHMGPEGSRMMGLPYQVGFPNTATLFGLDDVREVTALPVRRYLEYLSLVARPAGFTVMAIDAVRSPLLDLASVRWLIVRRSAAAPDTLLRRDPGLPLRWFDEHVAIYENLGALPRFRIAHSTTRMTTREMAARYVGTLVGTSGYARTDLPVGIEADARGRFPAPVASAAPAPDEVAYPIDAGEGDPGGDPDHLVLEAHLARDGFVVVADTYYPGWTATVDGKPAPVHPANLLFRAVPVPAGTHRVEMRYRPRSLQAGLALFLLAAASCAGVLWRLRGGGWLPARRVFEAGRPPR